MPRCFVPFLAFFYSIFLRLHQRRLEPPRQLSSSAALHSESKSTFGQWHIHFTFLQELRCISRFTINCHRQVRMHFVLVCTSSSLGCRECAAHNSVQAAKSRRLRG